MHRALSHVKVFGIRRDYQEATDGDIILAKTTNVFNVISTGGTILKNSRSKDFQTPEGRLLAAFAFHIRQMTRKVV